MTSRRSPVRSALSLAACALIATACSSGGDGDAEADGGTATGGGAAAGGTTGGQTTGGASTGGTETGGTETGGTETGGTETGGTETGGAQTGGAATGGMPLGGAVTGGAETGGADSGGATTGGTATGGTATGGTATGGTATGGTETGGTETGGTETGGAETGGTETGGADTGGADTGGADTGGADTGGADTGGAATGSGGASGTVPSSGCNQTPTLTSGEHSIQSGGQTRSFMLRIPDDYDNSRPYRLIFAFHWNGGTMNDIDGGGSSGYTWSYYGLREQADSSPELNTIFVAPQGNGNGWANPGGQDLAFVDAMVDQIEGDLCVDTTRIFAMGFSYGGGMSYAIACGRATVFRGVAVYSGAQLSGCEGGTEPIAYLGIHGISDGTCNIAGGRSLRDKFVGNNGCTAQTPPEPSAGSLTHTCTTYDGCDDGYPVEWCAFDGGHTPGMVDGGGDDGARTWTKQEAWKFFTQF